MAKRHDRPKNTESINPNAPFFKKCIAPIDEDEFLYYGQMAISAGQTEMPLKKSPTKYGVNLRDDETGEISRIRFTDNPINRMFAALIENLDNNERHDKMPAISTRMLALMELFSSGHLKRWVKPDPTSKMHALIPDAVFRAAAKAPVNTKLQFEWEPFKCRVEELLASDNTINNERNK